MTPHPAIAGPDDELVFLPLGGSNEIGMNFNLSTATGRRTRASGWCVDLGVTFGDPSTPGVDIIMPDPAFIEEHADDILGIVLTHAHEDHIGAVAWLWPRLKAPCYAYAPLHRLFCCAKNCATPGILDDVPLTEIPLGGSLTLGPFEMELITLTPLDPNEPNGVSIKTPLGTILHTALEHLHGKIDPDPLLGGPTDIDAIRRPGRRRRAGHGVRLDQRLRRRPARGRRPRCASP